MDKPAADGMYDDVEYMRGGRSLETSSSILRSTSKYLNSPNFREVFCNEALRLSGPDMLTTSLVPDFYQAVEPLLDKAAIARQIREDAARLPDFAEWLGERKEGDITYETVRNCAPDTLGAGVRQLFDDGYQIYFGRRGPVESDFDFIRKRRGETHDLEHIVTGCPTSLMGEVVLGVSNIVYTFTYFQPELARDMVLISNHLLASRIMRITLHYPEALMTLFDAIEKGKALGEAHRRPLCMEPLEDYLDWPLPKLRAHLNLPEPDYDESMYWSEPASAKVEAPAKPAYEPA